MKLIYTKAITKDVKHLKDKKLITKIYKVIDELKAVKSISKINNLKKMKSTKVNAYRIRIGDYRLGLYVNNEIITLARFVKRSDIYKVFP